MRRILVATDFSDRSERAVRRAGLLAQTFSAELELIHVVDDGQPMHLVTAIEGLVRSELEKMADALAQRHGIICQVTVARGDAFERLVALAKEKDVDLLVMGRHRKSPLKDIVVGTTLERVVRAQATPVLVVKADQSASHFLNILVSVDSSDCSKSALVTARRLGLLAGSRNTILCVSDPLDAVRREAPSGDIGAQIAADTLQTSRELTRFLGTIDLSGIQYSTRVRPHDGPPAIGIKKVADELEADLVIVGTRGRNRLVRMMLGSVTDDLLKTLDVDLLIVPCEQPEP